MNRRTLARRLGWAMVFVGLVPLPLLFGQRAIQTHLPLPVHVPIWELHRLAYYPGLTKLELGGLEEDVRIISIITCSQSFSLRSSDFPLYAEREIALEAQSYPDSSRSLHWVIDPQKMSAFLRNNPPRLHEDKNDPIRLIMNTDLRREEIAMLRSGTMKLRVRKIIWQNVLHKAMQLIGSPWAVPLGVLLSGAGMITARRNRQPAAGHCASCGYDLRATPAGTPCPECGNVPEEVTKPVASQ